MADKPVIVCLCGSTRFRDAYQAANMRETLAGRIVLSIGCNLKSDTEPFGHLSAVELGRIKRGLDELHLRKIDLADEILVLNVGGYIGQSTTAEIRYAKSPARAFGGWSSRWNPAGVSLGMQAPRTDYPYCYAWGNNGVRARLKGRRCRIFARGAMNTIGLEFRNGERVTTSGNSIRKVKRDE